MLWHVTDAQQMYCAQRISRRGTGKCYILPAESLNPPILHFELIILYQDQGSCYSFIGQTAKKHPGQVSQSITGCFAGLGHTAAGPGETHSEL